MSKHEIGLQWGSLNAAGDGLMIAYNRYLSEKHILHFQFTPVFGGGSESFMGGFEFWNEYRRFLGKSETLYFGHGLEFNIGDRNLSFKSRIIEAGENKFAVGLGYSIGFGKVINERLTFTATLKPRLNYERTSSLMIQNQLKPELALGFGINYRFK